MSEVLRRARGALTVVIAVLAVCGLVSGGSMLRVHNPVFTPESAPLVGRTGTVCAVPASTIEASTEVAAVALRKAPGREGSLTGTTLGEAKPSFQVTEQGKGHVADSPRKPLLLEGSGVMAIGSAGAVLTSATDGDARGLSAMPCTPPATEHWFVGVGASENHRTGLMLVNPDASQAEVDLRFYGAKGIVVVAGAPGVVVPAKSAVTIDLEALTNGAAGSGPLALQVLASSGRVSAAAFDLTSDNNQRATGAEWQVSATSPATEVVIPGVPSGAGSRQLVVTNPSTRRTSVTVSVLDSQGTYAPAGAEEVDLAPESTAAVELASPLAQNAAAIKLSSDQPITGAVIASSMRTGAAADFAVQSAATPILQTGVSAIAVGPGMDSSLILTNAGEQDLMVSIELLSYDGVSLRQDSIPIPAGSTDARQLNQTGAGYVVVGAPEGSLLYAGLALSQPQGEVAGLTTMSLVSPDVASRAPDVHEVPSVGR